MKKSFSPQRASMRVLVAVTVLFLGGVLAGPGFGAEMFVGTNGVVVSGQQLGASTALRILQQGGNAVDAIVGMFAVLSLTKPDMCGPGGGGWALIYMAKTGEVVALDMDTVAPAAASAKGFKDAFKKVNWSGPRKGVGPMVRGPLAPGVPGNVRGWESMLDRYGTMTFAEVLKPAIEYAEKGFAVENREAAVIKAHIPELSVFPTWVDTYTIKGRAPSPGERLYNKNLATTYKKIAAQGADVVYRGEIADEIDRYFKQIGGWITKKDLENYQVKWSEPIKVTYAASDGTKYTLYGTQPPSSSIEVLETLKILEGINLKAMGHNSVEYLHTVIEASKLAHVDNYKYVGDPGFVEVPVKKLLSEEYASAERAKIDPNKAREVRTWPIYPTEKKSSVSSSQHVGIVLTQNEGATTHSVVVDKDGNAVSMTNTLGTFYGCGFVVGNTGMLFGNGMEWMDLDINPWTNEKSASVIEPGKRNRWTLAPVMVFKDGKLFILTGGSGAETTAQGIVQPLLNVIEFGMDIQKAIDAPRFRWGDVYHYTGGTDLWMESFPEKIRQDLSAKGHKIVPPEKSGPNPLVGGTNAILISPGTRTPMAGFNARPGSADWAIGY